MCVRYFYQPVTISDRRRIRKEETILLLFWGLWTILVRKVWGRMGGDWLVCICSQDGEHDYSCSAPFLLSTQSKSLLILTNLDYKIPHRHSQSFVSIVSLMTFFPQDRVSLCHNPSYSRTSSVDWTSLPLWVWILSSWQLRLSVILWWKIPFQFMNISFFYVWDMLSRFQLPCIGCCILHSPFFRRSHKIVLVKHRSSVTAYSFPYLCECWLRITADTH